MFIFVSVANWGLRPCRCQREVKRKGRKKTGHSGDGELIGQPWSSAPSYTNVILSPCVCRSLIRAGAPYRYALFQSSASRMHRVGLFRVMLLFILPSEAQVPVRRIGMLGLQHFVVV